MTPKWLLFFSINSIGLRKVIRGEGMPMKGGGKGDLIVEFDVVFPDAPLNAAQKAKVLEARLD